MTLAAMLFNTPGVDEQINGGPQTGGEHVKDMTQKSQTQPTREGCPDSTGERGVSRQNPR